ncbi:MAG: hypothetical protein C4289_11785 [Chloroflexota bacterium]
MEAERITLSGAEGPGVDTLVERLAAEDALGQLLRREGQMAELATEAGDVKLDWVDGVEKALAHPEWLRAAEEEAAAIVLQGIRRVIWSGMGGSVQTVYTLKRMGYLDRPEMSIHPLDSTDPASLNRVLREIALAEGLPADTLRSAGALRRLLDVTMMIGVSMGMTSEEPITHLEWFDGLLEEYGIADRRRHLQVMTLPGSYLDQFARPRGAPMVPIQLDGENHTPGRMSAPATRVFLRPVALMLVAQALARNPAYAPDGAFLRMLLARGQALYRLSHVLSAGERRVLLQEDPFVRLGAYIAARTQARRASKLVLLLPQGWRGFAPWLEQLIEESLGKGGKGFLIFYDQDPSALDRFGDDVLFLKLRAGAAPGPEAPPGRAALELRVPEAAALVAHGMPLPAGLGELAGLFLGFKLTVATYGYLQNIVFAGQPAVEAYKKYARDLREAPGDVPFPERTPYQARYNGLTLYYSSLPERGLLSQEEIHQAIQQLGGSADNAAAVYAAILQIAQHQGWLGYLDFTYNGELSPEAGAVLAAARRGLANGALGLPAKVRSGPSDYHSTEQSETDGPPELVSLRMVARRHQPVLAGHYTDKFLLAQARGTWQAMEDAGRWVLMLTLPDTSTDSLAALRRFFADTARLVSGQEA